MAAAAGDPIRREEERLLVAIKSKRFDELIAEAESQPFAGWDFSYVKDRMVEAPLPWDYLVEVLERLSCVLALLDLGTGGGEVLSQIAPFPPRTFATEEYAPNAPIAARRLHPLGAQVVRYEAPMENFGAPGPPRPNKPGLPFQDSAFDLVIDRHEAYLSAEVFRILRPGGRFMTQQCGGTNFLELNDLLGIPRPSYEPWCLEAANAQLQSAGFEQVHGREQVQWTLFRDVGAVVYYLRTVPWQVPDFTVLRHLESLRDIHRQIETSGPLKIRAHHFLVEAVKPDQE
jgi:SAM-dependent methyltransferase